MSVKKDDREPGLFDGYQGNPEEERNLLRQAGLLFGPDHLVHAFLLEGDPERVQEIARALILRILVNFGGVKRDRVLSDSATDLISEREERVSIDRVRELTAMMYQKPIQGPYKIIFLEKADTILGPAQNALLKSLEEPPDHMVWILGANQRAKLLPTVQSRLRLVPLGSDHRMVEDPQALDLLLKLMEGRAESVFMSKDLLDGWKEDYGKLLEAWISYLNAALALQSGSRQIQTSPASRSGIQALANQSRTDQLSQAIFAVERTRQGLERNWNAKLALEHLCVQLAGKAGVYI